MSEKTDTIILANKILDAANVDPDSDRATLSRQFLRALERIETLEARLEAAEAINEVIEPVTADDLDKRTWRLVDLLAIYPVEAKSISPKTWEHLLVYDTSNLKCRLKAAEAVCEVLHKYHFSASFTDRADQALNEALETWRAAKGSRDE